MLEVGDIVLVCQDPFGFLHKPYWARVMELDEYDFIKISPIYKTKFKSEWIDYDCLHRNR